MSQVMLLIVLLKFKKQNHSKSNIYFLILIAIIYVLLFEYGRLFEDFVFRGSVTSFFYIICDAIGLYFLYALTKENSTRFSKLIFITAAAFFLNALLSIFRLTYLIAPDFYQLPLTIQNSVFIFILTQTFFTLIFLGVSYFWVEESGAGSKILSIETEQYRKLLDAKELSLKQLLLSQKSTMLGAYAHLVAHEINQPLATLQINADFLKELLLPKTELVRERGLVDSMIVEILRASTIIRSIKGLLTQDENGPSFFSLDVLATEVAQTQRKKMLENNIELNMSLNTATFIFADKNELQLVLMNLFENAIFAIASSTKSKSSNLSKITSKAPHFQNQIKLVTCFEGKNVVIKLMDNGPGVNPEYRNNLFELHNTSKAGGTGMGLWLSSFIAKRHQGALTYDDSYLEGASFSLVFPCMHQQVDI